MYRVARLLMCLGVLSGFTILIASTSSLQAQNLEWELARFAKMVVEESTAENGNLTLSLTVINQSSARRDLLALYLESELELALRQQLIKQKPFFQPPSKYEIQVSGFYRQRQDRLMLNLDVFHRHPDSGATSHSNQVIKANLETAAVGKKEVLVTDIQTSLLSSQLIDRFSNSLRLAIKSRRIFRLAPDSLRPELNRCDSVSCLADLGESLQVGFILLTKLEKLKQDVYVLYADLIDVEKKILLSRISVRHNGSTAYLEGSLEVLVDRISMNNRLLEVVDNDLARNRGHLQITSEPAEATIYLDDQRMNYVTNTLVRDLTAGAYQVRLKSGKRQVSRNIDLNAGEILQVHILFKDFQLKSVKRIENKLDPLRPLIHLRYSLPVDPSYADGTSVYLQQKARKIKGSIETSGDIIILTPLEKLAMGIKYQVVATRKIRSINGDLPEERFEGRFSLSDLEE